MRKRSRNFYTLLMGVYILFMAISSANAHEEGHKHTQALGFYDLDSIEVADELVSCTLSRGTKTQCYKITVQVSGDIGVDQGPWCPQNISDDAEAGGIWLKDGKVYDVDGEFIQNLATLYEDDDWQLYNPKTGKVRVTDSKTACLAAARPDVDPEYQNYCVQCLTSYMEEGTTLTYLIPAEPQPLEKTEGVHPRSGVGIAFNGVKIDAPAPVDAILGAHTIAAFDDCGGHVNTHVGYHYHAITDCTEKATTNGENSNAIAIGYALDGYKLYSHTNLDGSIPDDLDACGGHTDADVGYHYHVNDAGENQILSCFTAEPGCVLEGDGNSCMMQRGNRPPPPGGMGRPPRPEEEDNA